MSSSFCVERAGTHCRVLCHVCGSDVEYENLSGDEEGEVLAGHLWCRPVPRPWFGVPAELLAFLRGAQGVLEGSEPMFQGPGRDDGLRHEAQLLHARLTELLGQDGVNGLGGLRPVEP